MSQIENNLETPKLPARIQAIWPYLLTVVIMVLVTVIAILFIIAKRPDSDNTALIGQVLGIVAPTTAAILALMKANAASVQAYDTHMSINSRLDEWMAQNSMISHQEGMIEGKHAERARAAEAAKLNPIVGLQGIPGEKGDKGETGPRGAPGVSTEKTT